MRISCSATVEYHMRLWQLMDVYII